MKYYLITDKLSRYSGILQQAISAARASSAVIFVFDGKAEYANLPSSSTHADAWGNSVIADAETVEKIGYHAGSEQLPIGFKAWEKVATEVSDSEMQKYDLSKTGMTIGDKESYYVFRGGDTSQLEEFEREYEEKFPYEDVAENENLDSDGWVVVEKDVAINRQDVNPQDVTKNNNPRISREIQSLSKLISLAGETRGAKSLYKLFEEKTSIIAYADDREAKQQLERTIKVAKMIPNGLQINTVAGPSTHQHPRDLVVAPVRALGPKHVFWGSSVNAIYSTFVAGVQNADAKGKKLNVTDEMIDRLAASVVKDEKYFEKIAWRLANSNKLDGAASSALRKKARYFDVQLKEELDAFWSGGLVRGEDDWRMPSAKCVMCPAGWRYTRVR